jgi:predicted nucleic acid-binding protein
MTILLDTNILTRSAQPHHPMHQPAVDAVALLRQSGEALHLAPQNLYEFWVVATRPPGENGLGWTINQAQSELSQLETMFAIVGESPVILLEWKRLVVQYQVMGKNAHDARLVAAMIIHGINRILTFNVSDFQRYREITAISPESLLLSRG